MTEDESHAPPEEPRRYLRAIARVVIPLGGLALLAALLAQVGWTSIAEALGRIGIGTGLAILALGVGEILFDSVALRRAMLRQVGLAYTMMCNGAGTLVNQAVPFEVGEVVKGALLRRASRGGGVISGVVVWNYAFKLSKPALGVACFGVALILGHGFQTRVAFMVLAGVAASFLPYLALRILIRLRPAERGARLMARVPLLRRWTPRWADAAARLDAAVHGFWDAHPRAYLAVLGWQVAGRATNLVALGLMLGALGLPSTIGATLFVYAALIAADYITILVPARVGVNEAATFLLFKMLGLDAEAGLVIGLVFRMRGILAQAPFAVAALFVRTGK